VIEGGIASCTVRGEKLAQFRDGDFFGEMALLDGGPRTATVSAETQMQNVVYSSSEFRTMLGASSRVRTHLLIELAGRLWVADASV
jgi:CRP-like cAMP-binding protein